MPNGRVRFGEFEADLTSGELWRGGVHVAVQDLPFRLLAALLERPGELVTRAELTTRLWGTDTFVDAAAGLNTAVAKLREALGDDAEQPRYVETVPKRGYRFLALVESSAADADAAARLKPRAPSDAQTTGWRARLQPSGLLAWTFVTVAVVAVVALAAYRIRADRVQPRVAVVLFDNETGRPELAQLAQGLTDATVTELTAEPRLAVIGNAAILRTARPFRDVEAVRNALNADFIVIGQLQSRDNHLIVRAHLLRARDQSHVWVDVATLRDSEAALQADIAGRVRAAVTRFALEQR